MKRKPSLVSVAIKSARAEGSSLFKRTRARNAALPRIRTVLDGLRKAGSLKDVEEYGLNINISYTSDRDATVDLSLKQTQRDSQLIRDLVKLTGQPAHKAREYGGEALKATLTYERVEYRIHGYVPASCRLVEEDVIVPAQPERVEKRTKIICTPEEAPQSAQA